MAENDNAGEQKPKIIVDDDWKAQAKAEKERLAREVDQKQAAEKQAQAAPTGDAGAPTREAAAQQQAAQQPRKLPPANFTTHVNSLVTQAFMAMGGMEDPRTKQRYVDLDLAKHHIDTLTMLEEKTAGNLTDDEKQLLNQGLYECRMHFVHVAQAMSDMAAPGAEFQQ